MSAIDAPRLPALCRSDFSLLTGTTGNSLLGPGRPGPAIVPCAAAARPAERIDADTVLVPLTLERFGLDPALASGTFVTTLTDVMGFFAFLGLATMVLL